MQRPLLAIMTLATLATSTAVALEVERKDIAQMKPPAELRVDLTSPGLTDSLTSAPAVDIGASPPRRDSPEGAATQEGPWRPPSAE